MLSASLAQRREGSIAVLELFVEQSRLICGGDSSGGGFAASNAHDAKHGQFGERGAGDEDTVGSGIQIRRGDLDAVVEHGEKIIWNHAFKSFAVAVAQTDPKSVELRPAEKGLTFGLEVIGKLSNKIDRAHLGEGNFLMLAVRCQQVYGIGLAQASGIQIAAQGLFVGKHNDDFLVGRGWGSVFQRNQFVRDCSGRNLRIIKMYVMLSAFCLSTYCFH
jgi:hypothetical protein